ncbi:response regulator transcription factor [Actinomadura sp. NEAU-AAG7]|uniref:response regulator n=1 Tax=Actinomadura sp. NEAU-AAG7 TaxID=2839640 RepID=UPI001BE40B0E|nr:response regulator transcription factor [Actinomadura sp. NEAU-AAG7]MBT2208768.1 response regulator transcription factor [Actinomadura sp. NEAU-AAG7]
MSVPVLIIEDHPLYLGALRALFERGDGFEVVAEAATGAAALEALEGPRGARPRVITLDLHLPDGSGTALAQRVLAAHPQVRVLVISALTDRAAVLSALRAGVHGYLTKDAGSEEIRHAVRLVAAGGTAFGEPIAVLLRDWLKADAGASARTHFPTLTGRETQVLDLLAGGREYAQIARELGISEKTVRNHLSNLFVKLEVNNRAQAILVARRAGMGTS